MVNLLDFELFTAISQDFGTTQAWSKSAPEEATSLVYMKIYHLSIYLSIYLSIMLKITAYLLKKIWSTAKLNSHKLFFTLSNN